MFLQLFESSCARVGVVGVHSSHIVLELPTHVFQRHSALGCLPGMSKWPLFCLAFVGLIGRASLARNACYTGSALISERLQHHWHRIGRLLQTGSVEPLMSSLAFFNLWVLQPT